MTEKINANEIKINTNDIKEFLLRIGILKETQSGESCRVRLFINGEKIPINSIEDLASIKMENNKKIDRMNIDFCDNKTKRSVALKLCYDSEKNLYFKSEDRMVNIRIREFTPTICISPRKSVKINGADLKKYLLARRVKKDDIDKIDVKTTVNWQENHLQKLEDFLIVKSSDEENIDYLKLSFVSRQANLLREQLSDLTLILQKDSSGFYFENLADKRRTSIGFTIEIDNENFIYFGSLKKLIDRYSIVTTGFFGDINRFFNDEIKITFRIKYENTNDWLEYKSKKKYKSDDELSCNILSKNVRGKIEQFEVFISPINRKDDQIKINGKRNCDNTDFNFIITSDCEEFLGYAISDDELKEKLVSDIDSRIDPETRYEKICFGNTTNLVYQITNLNKDFVDWSDAKSRFRFISFVKDDESGKWIKNSVDDRYLDSDFTFVLYRQFESMKIGGIKIFIRHENYKNISQQGNTKLEDVKMSDLSKYGFFEMDVKKNRSKNGAYFELIDKSGNHVCYGDTDKQKISKINDDNKFLDGSNEFRQKFEIGITNSNEVFAADVKGYCCDDMRDRSYIFLGKETHLTFAEEPFDKKKNQYHNSIATRNNFYVRLGSQALNNILDVFFENKCLPCNCLTSIDDEIANSWDYNKDVDYNLHEKKLLALGISDFTFNKDIEINNFDSEKKELKEAKDGLDFAIKFCKLLSKLKKPDSKFDFDLYCSDDVFGEDVKQMDISEQQIGHSIFIFGSKTGVKFEKNFLDNSNCITKFYVLKNSQAVQDISDFVENNQNACIKIYFMQDRILENYTLNKNYDVFYRIHSFVLDYLGNIEFIRQEEESKNEEKEEEENEEEKKKEQESEKNMPAFIRILELFCLSWLPPNQLIKSNPQREERLAKIKPNTETQREYRYPNQESQVSYEK